MVTSIPEPSVRMEHAIFTTDYAAVVRMLHEFESVLTGAAATTSLAILGHDPVHFTDEEAEDYVLLLDKIDTLSRQVDNRVYAVLQEDPFRSYFWQFLDATPFVGSAEEMLQKLWVFIEDKRGAGTRAGVSSEDLWSLDHIMETLRTLHSQFVSLFALYGETVRAQTMVAERLGSRSQVASFLGESQGYHVSNRQEGFRVQLDTGKVVTLIAK